ncbi:MAG TPA: DNA-3-methyladenine glycosylase [Opitutaceae bacterium]
MGRIIQAKEVRSRGTVRLARWLLGKALVRTRGGRREAFLITETEAYDSERDLASHASKGLTPRTETLYLAGGVWYVYFVYGMHHMLNLVTGPEGYPAAILIRGVESLSGPGRITKALGIDKRLNGAAASSASGLRLEDVGVAVPRGRIRSSPRVGVDYAGPHWAAKPWRFQWIADPAVPGKKPGSRPRRLLGQ